MINISIYIEITERFKGIIRKGPLTEQEVLQGFSWILFGFGVFLCIMIFMYATNARGEEILVVFAILPVAIGLIFIKLCGSREKEGSNRKVEE